MADELTDQRAHWVDPDRTVAQPFAWVHSFSWRRAFSLALLTIVSLYAAATVFRLYVRKYYIFLPDYLRWTASAAPPVTDRPTHVFLIFVDHFEPDYDVDRVRGWADRYRMLANRHHDSDGRPPQHTWFYPGEQATTPILEELARLAAGGFGEVELHYHHDYDSNDTFRLKLRDAIEDFQRFGFLKTVDGGTHFAFIHGNGALDNSAGPLLCGVNQELTVLRKMGCYGDFSFPSIFTDSQPPVVNRIYAAKDDAGNKSYGTELPLAALDDGRADLMIFQGPLVFAPTLNVRHLFLDLDDGNIHPAMPASPDRVDNWIRADVHVPQRPDWLFIKIFTHGISSSEEADVVLGPTFDSALSYLEHEYNDGTHHVLHYVTAREAYNLVRAAIDGESGEPEQYLDWTIPPYVANQQLTGK